MQKSWAAYEFTNLGSRHKAATTAITFSGSLPSSSSNINDNNSPIDSNNNNNNDDHDRSEDPSKNNSNNNRNNSSSNNNSNNNYFAAGRRLPNGEISPSFWGACDVPPLGDLGAPADAEEAESAKALLNQIEILQRSAQGVQAAANIGQQNTNAATDLNTSTSSAGEHQYLHPSTDYLCFFDSDERYRSSEERASEAVLEQSTKSASEHIEGTRHRMTKPVRNLLLPIHPDIPSAFKLRLERDRFAASAATVLTQEPTISSGEVMAVDIIKTLTDAQSRTAPVSGDSLIGVPLFNALTSLRIFLDKRMSELPRVQLRLLQRYISSSFHDVALADGKSQSALLRAARNSFAMIADEMDMLKSAAQRVGTYHERLQVIQRRKDASHATTEAGTQPEDAMLSAAVPSAAADAIAFEHDHSLRIVEELRSDDFRSYLHALNTEVRMNRKIERLVAQVEMLPLAKRFEMYTEAINASIDGNVSGWRPASSAAYLDALLNNNSNNVNPHRNKNNEGDGEDSESVTSASQEPGSGVQNDNSKGGTAVNAFGSLPTLVLERTAVSRQLSELCSCFGLEPHLDGSDTHSFVFGVTRKASIVFQAQQRSMSFLSEKQVQAALASLHSAGEGTSSSSSSSSSPMNATAAATQMQSGTGADGDGDFGLSKPKLRGHAVGAGSAASLFLDADSSDQPAWLIAQRAAIAAVAPKPHPALDAEMKFVAETNFQTIQNRWKERAAKGGANIHYQTASSASLSAGSNTNIKGPSALQDHGSQQRSSQAHPSHHLHPQSSRLDSTTTQRLFCVFLLRFIRIREIRRRVFAALNFFASVERKIAIDCQTVAGASGLKQSNIPLSAQPPASAENLTNLHPHLFGDTNPSVDASSSFETLLNSAADAAEATQKWFTMSMTSAGNDPLATAPNTVVGMNNRANIPLGSFNTSPDDPLAPVDSYRQPESFVNTTTSGSTGSNAQQQSQQQQSQQVLVAGSDASNGREFTWSVIDGTSCPMRSSLSAPTPVVYKAAIAALVNTETEAAMTASYFIAQRADAAFQQQANTQRNSQESTEYYSFGNDNNGDQRNQQQQQQQQQQQRQETVSISSAANIDYLALLEEVLESEGWFAEAKRDVVASLFTAYCHTTDVTVQSELGKQILEVIRRRPRIDLRDTNFVKSYSAEILSLEMQAGLLKDVLDHQIRSFREVVSELGMNVVISVPPLAAAAGSSFSPSSPNAYNSSNSDQSQTQNQQQLRGPRTAAPCRIGLPFYLPWNDNTDGGPLPLFRPVPTSNPSSVFEIITSTASIHKVIPAAKTALKAVLGRFPDLDKDAASQLQLEVTVWREMIDAWHVLDEEDRSNRDMLQMRPGRPAASASAAPAPASTISAVAPPPPTHLYWNLFDDPPTFDALMKEIASSSPVFGGGKSAGAGGGRRDNNPNSNNNDDFGGKDGDAAAKTAALGLRRNPADLLRHGHNDLSPSDALTIPTPGPLVLTYVAAIESLQVRTRLIAALHRTELLYNCHRRQATMMGITIKRQQLDPIDFEARRAFAEVDRVEQLQNRMDAVGAGAPPTSGNIDDGERVILSVSLPVELLPRLAIAEFDAAMSRFDFSSETGIRRLLTSQLGDLHRALSIQVASKNLASCIVGMNNAPIDLYLENLARKRWEALALKVADSTFLTNATGLVASPMDAAACGLRKLHWPTLDHGDDPLEDRALLQQLYVSLNHVKSSLRRNILQELNTHASADAASVAAEANTQRATGFLRMPAADLARRRTKILKEVLLEEYCNASSALCVRYGAILDSIWHATHLRWFGAQHPDVFRGLFNFGGMFDRVRNVPLLSASNQAQQQQVQLGESSIGKKQGASSGVSFIGAASTTTQPGTAGSDNNNNNNNNNNNEHGGASSNVVLGGLLSRSGLVDDYRYVPHPVQLMVTDYDPQTTVSQLGHHPMTPPEPRLGGSKQQARTFIECSILSSLCEILSDYHSIVKLSRSHSIMSLSQQEALTVLHFPAPPAENALTTDELREQRRGAKRYRVRAWNSLESHWRAHLTICQRDSSYFIQQALGVSTDGFLEPHGFIRFLSNCHKVQYLKFNALSRSTLEELKSLDALMGSSAASSSSSSSSALGGGGEGGFGGGGGGGFGSAGSLTLMNFASAASGVGGSGSGANGSADDATAAGDLMSVLLNGNASTGSHRNPLQTKAQAALAAQRAEIMQLQSDLLRSRAWTHRIDSFVESEDFMNRTSLCRQTRSTHPMVLFLQQLRGGIRRVFIPIVSSTAANQTHSNLNDLHGNVNVTRISSNAAGQRVGVVSNSTNDHHHQQHQQPPQSPLFHALPPHGWPFSPDVAATVLKHVQALVGNTPPPLTEGAAHMHHLLDSLHLALLATWYCRQRITATSSSLLPVDVCSAYERFPVYENAPSLIWLACSQRTRAIWKREVDKFESVSSNAGSIIDVFDPNRQRVSEGGDAFGGRSDASNGNNSGGAAAALAMATSSAAIRDVTVMADQALQSKSKAHSRGSDYAIALRILIDTVRRDQLRDACMILVRQEKMPAFPSGQSNQQLVQQGAYVTSAAHSLHSNNFSGSSNPNASPSGSELHLRHASFQMMHAIASEWTTRMMAKTRKWIERLDLLARETAMAVNSGEILPSFVPPFVVGCGAPLLQRLAEIEAENQMRYGSSANQMSSSLNVNSGSQNLPNSINININNININNNVNPNNSGGNSPSQASATSSSFSTRDIRSRIVTAVMMGELHRMLLKRSIRDVQSTVAILEATTKLAEEHSAAVAPESTDVKERLAAVSSHQNIHDPASDAAKQEIFSDFANILVSRSSVVRDEFGPGGTSNPIITYQIPETALSLALSTVARRLGKWCYSKNLLAQNYFSSLLGAQQRRISALEADVVRLETQRELDQKLVTRRVHAAISDHHFALLFDLDHLSKEVGSLSQQLVNSTETVRAAVTAEFEEKLSKLHQQLLLSQGQYRTFQRRLQDQLQNSLEGIKRDAILSVTKMDSAPMHMKKQALKLALVDDELHSLKRENSVLRQTVLKAKLWFEVRLLRQRSEFENRIHELETAMEDARGSFWTNKELAVQEREKLRANLEDTQIALARGESEVDQLRRDLQTQVGSRRDMTTYKAQQAKLVAELQAKIRRLEQQRARMVVERQQLEKTYGVVGAGGGGSSSVSPHQQQQHQQQQHPQSSDALAGSLDQHHGEPSQQNQLSFSPIEKRDSPQSQFGQTVPRRSGSSPPQQQQKGGPPRPPSSDVLQQNQQNQHNQQQQQFRVATPLGTRRRLIASAGGNSTGAASSTTATTANNNSRPQSRNVHPPPSPPVAATSTSQQQQFGSGASIMMNSNSNPNNVVDNLHHHLHHRHQDSFGINDDTNRDNDFSSNAATNPAQQALIRQLRAQLERERAMKHQAMARAEQLQKERDDARVGGKSSSATGVASSINGPAGASCQGGFGDASSSTAALWQRKYVEAAQQIQHLSGELAKVRNQLRLNQNSNSFQQQPQQQQQSSSSQVTGSSDLFMVTGIVPPKQ